MGGDMQERISVRAYRIWEEKGRPDGSAEDHWHQAKREIEEEDKAGNGKTAAKPKATRTRKPAAAARSVAKGSADTPSKAATPRKTPARSAPAGKKKS